ncbi:hypothetical protein GQ53DRAFT_408703 [Thozetella sp. PMI_491]|nr:hypothetical protein GQ53DRAFT_408703 [Thozetella sp. PMI_491]
MSTWSATHRDSRTPTPTSSPPNGALAQNLQDPKANLVHPPPPSALATTHNFASGAPVPSSPVRGEYVPSPVSLTDDSAWTSPAPTGRQRSNSRLSMVQPYQPKTMNMNEETIPELLPIFGFLNNHSNKLYQEGYFLKLDDQDSKGKPNPDRTWTECFAQLVGTVLSLWDAAELDAAGDDGEVLPKFLNLTDASIKMIESLPTKSNDEDPLQNILSISTAGRNRYLLHFNSHHSLLQWTAGIRLAMYEHTTLQEAYTGALIAGKGKLLNNIGVIMERSRFKVEEWVRVRFGAGVPWRRCWCVITPPDEKEYQKVQKDWKKRNPYDRSHPPLLKGDIKFYDSKKDAEKKKRSRPIATINDAYAAYALYPQSRSLIENSTLLKVEGNITIHSDPPSATEGFVFIMPETHPAVSGFEMLLRFLFPTWDTFGLYGRPGRLVASVLDARSLMFAMPKHKKYGYLEILDVTGLITMDGNQGWSERDWRKKMKELTGTRMSMMDDAPQSHSRSNSRSSKRLSFGPQPTGASRPRVNFADDSGSPRSSRSLTITRPGQRTDSAPPDPSRHRAAPAMAANNARHSRNISDTQLDGDFVAHGFDAPTGPGAPNRPADRARTFASDLASTPERVSSEDERPIRTTPPGNIHEGMGRMETPEPVNAPPSFSHTPGARPQQQPYHSPEMRRANSRLSSTTLSQLAKAGGLTPETFPDDPMERHSGEDSSTAGQLDLRSQAVQQPHDATPLGMNANLNGSREALTLANPPRSSPGLPPPQQGLSQHRSRSPLAGPAGPPPPGPLPNYRGPPPPLTSPTGPLLQGRGQPPMMSPRGPPPDGRPYSPKWDPRMGPPPPGAGYSPRGPPPNGPPPGPRRTPPPNPALQRQPPPHLQGGGSPPINRKPLPARTTSLKRQEEGGSAPPSPTSSNGSFTQRVLEEAGMGGGRQQQPVPRQAPATRQPIVPTQGIFRQNSETSSRYDDASSTASPDYASTRKSTDTQESVDRPRAGVLKTVGAGQTMAVPAPQADPSSDYSIPDIDFGRTINYSRSKTPTLPSGGATNGPNTGVQPNPRQLNTINTSQGHTRQESDDTIRRSVAWQPGMAVTSPGAERVLSPEEFVQQRAAAAPMYAHQRNPSGNTLAALRTGTPTPPLARPGSGQAFHSRSNSADLLQNGRPLSQGTAAVLSGGEMSSYLSAREQEHVARMTGSPLIAVAGNKGPAQQAGLVGAIDARERERAQMKQGFAGQAVAQAIDQRQREQHQQAQRAAQAAYAQQQAQLAAQQQNFMAQGMVGGAPAPSMYGGSMGGMRSMSPGPGMMSGPRSHSPGPGMMAPRSYSPGPGMMAPRSHSPGPGLMGRGMGPPRLDSNFQPIGGPAPMQGRPPMMANQGSYGQHPAAQAYAQGGGWANPNMRPPQSPGFPPAQGQFGAPGNQPGARPGTPGRMPFQGQAF